MKKLSIFATLSLAVAMNYSCSQVDSPIVIEEPKTVIELDGNKYETDLVATFQGEVGAEVTLTLGVYDQYDIYGVDFGDGTIVADTVCYQNGGLKDENGLTREDTEHKSATAFKGTIAGDGIVKVYGNSDVWYINTLGGVAPTSFDQQKLQKVVQVSIGGANVSEVVLPQLDSLKTFAFNNSPVQKVDVSKAQNLTKLSINSTSVSKYEPQLASIDLSKNVNLEELQIQGNTNNYGKLTSLDLTNNTKLTGMGLYVQYNQISELKLGENTLTAINVQNNQLTSLDTDKLPLLKNLYAADNQLKSIDVSKMENLVWLDVKNNQLEGDLDLTANTKFTNVYVNGNQLTSVKVADVTKQFYFDNNRMTFATIPAKPAGLNTASKTKQYHYAPQAALEVPAEVAELDLSDQLTAVGIETEAKTTTYSFVTASGTALVEGTDYAVVAPGKFKFTKPQGEKVHGVLANEALPLFTGDNAFVTTEFTVK